MKCGWSKLDNIKTDCEKINLKKRRPEVFSSLSRFSLKQVVNNKIRLRNHPNISFTYEFRAIKKNDTGKNRKKWRDTAPQRATSLGTNRGKWRNPSATNWTCSKQDATGEYAHAHAHRLAKNHHKRETLPENKHHSTLH